jgi:hypothetical protein
VQYVATYRIRENGRIVQRAFDAPSELAAEARAHKIAQERALYLLEVERQCDRGGSRADGPLLQEQAQ